jgi:hypothetical protein
LIEGARALRESAGILWLSTFPISVIAGGANCGPRIYQLYRVCDVVAGRWKGSSRRFRSCPSDLNELVGEDADAVTNITRHCLLISEHAAVVSSDTTSPAGGTSPTMDVEEIWIFWTVSVCF